MPLTVALYSAASSVAPEYEVMLYVLDAGITPETRARSETCLRTSHPKVTLQWVIPDLSDFTELDARRYTVASFLRLQIPAIVPLDIERVLYIDCDVVVDDDITQLWALDLGDAPIWAVADRPRSYFYDRIGFKFKEISARKDAPYFNSGVLLMNLNSWRKMNVSENAIAFLYAYCAQLYFPDQDALNAVSVGKWGELEKRWNAQTHRMNRWCKSTGITHYTSHKPWTLTYTGPRAALFFRAYYRTGWDTKMRSAFWIGGRILMQSILRNKKRILRYAKFKQS